MHVLSVVLHYMRARTVCAHYSAILYTLDCVYMYLSSFTVSAMLSLNQDML